MKDIQKILEEKGLKVTKQRLAVLEVLISSKGPLDIDALFKVLKIQINKTTLYRILHTYSEMGLVYQTDFRDGKAYFEFQDTHHHHIVCTQCGKREGIKQCAVETDVGTLVKESSAFHTITTHSLEFFGICNDCA